MTPQALTGLSEIADRYDIFVVDQWGVLHDGAKPHAGARDALLNLKKTGAAVVLLSNSGKRVAESHRRLAALGFERDLYDLALTSGEQVYEGLSSREGDFYGSLGDRYLMFAWDDDRSITEGTGFEETKDIEEADFILCAGTDRASLDAYTPILSRALDRGLPMTCANPDRVSVQPDGSLKICPGAIAERYEAMGGRVQWHGKPQQNAYRRLREVTGISGPGLGIGDSLSHDVKGAADAGMDSVFVTGGIHATDLPEAPTPDDIIALGRTHDTVPTFYQEFFVWD